MEPAPGEPGHGNRLTSIRRRSGKVARSAETDEWVIPYEIICPDCGDTGGPPEEQPESVLALRGPYADAAVARQAMQRHIGAAPPNE